MTDSISPGATPSLDFIDLDFPCVNERQEDSPAMQSALEICIGSRAFPLAVVCSTKEDPQGNSTVRIVGSQKELSDLYLKWQKTYGTSS